MRIVLLAGLLGACAAAPLTQDPLAALAIAEQRLTDGDPQAAAALLEAIDEESYTGRDLERFKLRLATAQAGSGEHWEGFKTIRDFTDDHPFSDLRAQVELLEFQIGRHLIGSDGGFLFFTSDREDGRIVLEHLVQRAMLRRDVLADALRLLGEKAFAEQDYELARLRYTQLRRDHEDSEWVPLAQFRMAMCRFYTLEGPDYDLVEMELARRELGHLLDRGIENPKMQAEVAAAATQVEEWLGARHLGVARFYRRIGNRPGEELHLRRAAEDYPETQAGRTALRDLGSAAAEGR